MNGPRCVLGIDVSTTGVKAMFVAEDGEILAEGRAPLSLMTPEPEGFEQAAIGWWGATCTAVKAALEVGGPVRLRAQLAGLAIAHQRETVVVTDAEGRPRHPALVWMDNRCRPQAERVRGKEDAGLIHELTGKPVSTTPSLYKLMWLAETRPEVFRGDIRVCDVHAYLVFRLTGHFRTSVASADPMGLIDMRASVWAEEVLRLTPFGVQNLPELFQVGEQIGTISKVGAKAIQLPIGLPIFAGAGDGQAAGLGAGIVAPGPAYLNLGTAVVSGVLSPQYRTDSAFRTLYSALPRTYVFETEVKGGTFTLDWLVKRWLGDPAPAGGDALAALEAQAARLPPGAQGLMAMPYWCGVMNPYYDDAATGAVIGWREHHGPAHLYRAIIEGLAFEQRLHFEGVRKAARVAADPVIAVGEGARSDLWCQILADVLGLRVYRAPTSDVTALGAAGIAAMGSGMLTLREVVSRFCERAPKRLPQDFQPGAHAPTYGRLYEGYRGLYPALKRVMRSLADDSGDGVS